MTVDDIVSLVNAYDKGEVVDATNTTTPDVETTPVAESVPTDEVTGTLEPQVAEQVDKDNNAFAEMRVNNKTMADTLKRVADAMGLKYNSQDDMISQLNGDAFNKLSERQGVPVEYLKRMEALEAQAQEWEAQKNQANLITGLKNIQTKYGLDQAALMNFAQQIDNSGVNLATVDLEKEYISRNLDSIVAARVQAAVQAALQKDAAASASAATIAATGTGAGGTTPEVQIKSAADLVSFLKQNAPGYK